MKNFVVMFGFVLAAMLSSMAYAEYEDGHEYIKISSSPPVAKDAPIEVVEFFWYGCPHCFSFEPFIKKWLENKPEDIKFSRIPATFNKIAKFHAQAFYALDLMGEADRLQGPMFDAMHNKKKKLATNDELNTFLAEQGVDLDTYKKAMKSFAVQTKVKQAQSTFRKYGLRGVPSMVVNGRYRSANVKDYQELTDLIDYMIELVREEQKTAG